MRIFNFFKAPDGRFSFDKAALLRVAKGLAYTTTAAVLTYLIAHVADLEIGVYAQSLTVVLTALLHLLTVYCSPTEDPAPTPTQEVPK